MGCDSSMQLQRGLVDHQASADPEAPRGRPSMEHEVSAQESLLTPLGHEVGRREAAQVILALERPGSRWVSLTMTHPEGPLTVAGGHVVEARAGALVDNANVRELPTDGIGMRGKLPEHTEAPKNKRGRL
eukprot:15476035-Alexandrium_andersonii.AAC.4